MLAKIRCNAIRANGERCGESATVTKIHYNYRPRLVRPEGDVEQVLTETVYDIECPKCGTRAQRVKVKPA